MAKKCFQRVIYTLFVLFILGIWFIPHQAAATTDDFTFTFHFGWGTDPSEEEPDYNLALPSNMTLILFNFYLCEIQEDGTVVQLETHPHNFIDPADPNKYCVASCEFWSYPHLEQESADPTFSLPKDKKFILEIIPLLRYSLTSQKVMPTGFRKIYFNLKNSLDEISAKSYFDDEDGCWKNGHIIDTGQSEVTKTINLWFGRKISGTVTAGGNIIPGVKVKVWDESKKWVSRYGVSGASSGSYTIQGLSPGKYYLRADGDLKGYIKQYYDGADFFTEAQLIDVTESNASNINFTLEEGKFVTGRLLDPDDPNNPNMGLREPVQLSLVHPSYPDVPLATYFHDPNHSQKEFYTNHHPLGYEYLERYLYTLYGVDLAYVNFNENGYYSIGGFPEDLNEGWVILKAEGYKDFLPWILYKMSGERRYAPLYYPNAYFLEDAEPIPLNSIGTENDPDFDILFTEGGKIGGSVKVKGNETEGIKNIMVMVSDTSGKTPLYVPFAYTDDDGHYEIDGLPLLDYKALAIDATDREYKYQQQYYNNKFNPVWAAKIHVREEKRIFTDINFQLPVGQVITGYVKDASGQKLSNIAVKALRLTSDVSLANYPNTDVSGTAYVDPNARYWISGLSPGRYILQAVPMFGENYLNVYYPDTTILNEACSIDLKDPNIDIEDPDRPLYNFTLTKGGRITGKVTGIPKEINSKFIIEPIEKSMPFFHIGLYEAKTGGLMGKTNEEITAIDPNTWRYEIMGIPQGEYKIGISDELQPKQMIRKFYIDPDKEFDPNDVFLYNEASILVIDPMANPNIIIRDVDFHWDTEGATIEGDVEIDSQEEDSLSRIRIEAYRVEEEKFIYTGIYVDIYVDTNNEASYSLTGLSKGKYVLKASDVMNHFYATEYYQSDLNSNAFDPNTAAEIEIPSRGTVVDGSYDFRLNTYGTIKGTITKGKESPSPFSGAWVYLYNAENKNLLSPNQIKVSDSNGQYAFTGLSEGNYKVRAMESLYDTNRSFVSRFFTSDPDNYAFNLEEGEAVSLNYPNPTENIDICLWKEGARITGEVTLDGDDPFSDNPYLNIYIYLFKDNGELSLVDTTYVDPNGRYQFQYLPSGDYKALIWDYEEMFYPSYSNQSVISLDHSGNDANGINFSLAKVEEGSQQDYTIELSEGLNIFCLPVGPPIWSAFYNASNLYNDWNNSTGTGIKDFLDFNTEIGKWENRYSGFLIESGKGYVAYSHNRKMIKYYGTFPTGDIHNVYPGMNIVGNIGGDQACNSHQMMLNWATIDTGSVHSIRRYEAAKGKWLSSTLLWGKTAGEMFDISPTEGYIIDIK